MDFTSREQGHRDFTNIPFNQASSTLPTVALKKINGRLEFGVCSDACFKLGEQCKDRRRGKSRSLGCLRFCDQAIQSEGIAGERPGSPGPALVNVKDVFCNEPLRIRSGPDSSSPVRACNPSDFGDWSINGLVGSWHAFKPKPLELALMP